jgi:hypothetical protein
VKRSFVSLAACTLAAASLLHAAPSAAADTWVMTGVTRFYLGDALQRSQGLVFDTATQSVDFSWQLGLQRTSADYASVLANKALAIPRPIRKLGGNHIGSIDYHAGKIYAPIEDGPAYVHPVIALFDAETLAYTGTSYPLPADLQNDGVPWVAIDEPRGLVYVAKWDPVDVLNVFDLATFAFVKQIPLDPIPVRIQGGKVWNGAFYASADDGARTVYRIDLDTGHVTELFHMVDLPGVNPADPLLEAEGLAFYPAPDGSTMHVILIQTVTSSTVGAPAAALGRPTSSLYHFADAGG